MCEHYQAGTLTGVLKVWHSMFTLSVTPLLMLFQVFTVKVNLDIMSPIVPGLPEADPSEGEFNVLQLIFY